MFSHKKQKRLFNSNAWTLYQKDLITTPLSTLNKNLDEHIRITPGIITEICGHVGAPSTRLCLQLSISAIVSSNYKGTAVYIDTNQRFSPHLLQEICVEHKLPEAVLAKIKYAFCADYIELQATIIQQYLSDDPIKLIVIDSIVKPFRELSDNELKTRELHRLLSELQKIAVHRDIPIVITNEYTTIITEQNPPKVVPSLGASHFHRIGQRLNFTNFEIFSTSKSRIK